MPENPLLAKLENIRLEKTDGVVLQCKYKDAGCTWTFNATKMPDHINECKFRTLSCIGHTLNVWKLVLLVILCVNT